jgi:hypothetical protein
VTAGHVATFANSGQIQDGGTVSYTNFGINTNPCTTSGASGASCTTVVSLNKIEADTNYKVSCTGIGPSQFPYIGGVTKATGSVSVLTFNGTSNMAQASTYTEIDCVITR